jgi:hypothetical protein
VDSALLLSKTDLAYVSFVYHHDRSLSSTAIRVFTIEQTHRKCILSKISEGGSFDSSVYTSSRKTVVERISGWRPKQWADGRASVRRLLSGRQ